MRGSERGGEGSERGEEVRGSERESERGKRVRGGEEVKHLAKWTLILSSLIKEMPGNRPF